MFDDNILAIVEKNTERPKWNQHTIALDENERGSSTQWIHIKCHGPRLMNFVMENLDNDDFFFLKPHNLLNSKLSKTIELKSTALLKDDISLRIMGRHILNEYLISI